MTASLLLLAIAVLPTKPVWSGDVAGYRLIEWDNKILESQTLVLKDPRGRVVTTISDYRAYFEGDDQKIRTYYLTNDGIPTIELETWTAGAHGSNTYYLWKLGPHPKCLLAYDKNNVLTGDDFDFEVIPPSKGHPAQIKTWYDGFAYLGGSGSNFNSVIPVVLDLDGDRFVDRTIRYPQVLSKAAKIAWADLAESGGLRRPAMILLAIADLRGTLPGLWPALKHEMRGDSYSYQWIEQHKRELLAIARSRYRRYSYPRAYSR